MHLSSPQRIVVALGLLASFPTAHAGWQDYEVHSRTPASCPDYTEYSQKLHKPFSMGPLALPFMRPSPECRTFNSSAVEKVISDIKARIEDPDLAHLFENTFSSTLDTTVKYFDPDKNLAFIITGDINAQWLRDTGNQFAHLHKLLPQDDNLKALVKAIINTEARYIASYPYCGSFQPPPESGLKPTVNDYATNVIVNPPVDNQTVFECKYELDSLASFFKITRSYYANTKDSSFFNDNWKTAMNQIFKVLYEQMVSSWDRDGKFLSYYSWTGTAGSLSPPVPNGGNGEPKKWTGMSASSHRPSDDLCVFKFVTAANAMMVVELDHLADMLDKIGNQTTMSSKARQYSRTLNRGIWAHARTPYGILAYETNGYGGQYTMDDANVPSLVSLPYLGFVPRDHKVYRRTKDAMFSRDNPYYAASEIFSGIGGPHVGAKYPWPMSHISAIFGTERDKEIKGRLSLILNSTSGLGLIHESVNMYNTSDYTRPWFAWANSYFAEMILDLAERKPGLIFKDDKPYVIGKGGKDVWNKLS